VDYVAMDVKNSPSLYPQTTGTDWNPRATEESLCFLLADTVDLLFEGQLPCDGSILTNARQYDAVRRSVDAIESALHGLHLGYTPDAVLIDVEAAMEAIGEVTGATVREDITARIFERFCVGK